MSVGTPRMSKMWGSHPDPAGDLGEGYLALVVALAMDCTPEMAFARLSRRMSRRAVCKVTPEDIADMKVFRQQGLTYKEIGEMYGLSEVTIYGKLRDRNHGA